VAPASFTSISDEAWAAIKPCLPPGAPGDESRQLLDHLGRCFFERPPDLRAEQRALKGILASLRKAIRRVERYNRQAAYLRIDLESQIPPIEAELARLKACKTSKDRLYFALLEVVESWGARLAKGESDYVREDVREFFNAVLEALDFESLADSTLRGVIRRYKKGRPRQLGFVTFAESVGF
jgi:hypothetical protein